MKRALLFALLAVPSIAGAQDLVLDEAVPADAAPYFEVPFTVPAGTVEIEVRHDDMSDANILDWGLRDPDGFRGWGGGNTEPAIVGESAASRSYVPGAIAAGEWAVLIGQALVTEAPARYHVEIFFRTTPTLAPQPERAPYTASAALRTGPAWFAGDFHVHSRESGDAHPTLDEIATFARSRGLDFVELSEHNVVSQLDFVNDAQSRHPELLLIPGIEVTTYWGHANAIGATEWIDFRVESGVEASIDTVLASADAQGAAFSINHPVLDLGMQCLGCAWDLDADPSRVHAVELQNGAYSITGTIFYRNALRFWDQLLANGGHVAAIGGSDDHRAGTGMGTLDSAIGSPTTMVYAEELSVAAIVEAVRAGRTVVKLEAPGDPMVELTAGALLVGDTIEDRTAELRARVTGGQGATIFFVRNGRALDPIEVDADPFEAALPITAPGGDDDDRYRVQLELDGRPRVVTSHVWIRATGEPIVMDAGTPDAGTGSTPSGCGCRAVSTRGGEIVWPLVLLLVLRRRPRRGSARAVTFPCDTDQRPCSIERRTMGRVRRVPIPRSHPRPEPHAGRSRHDDVLDRAGRRARRLSGEARAPLRYRRARRRDDRAAHRAGSRVEAVPCGDAVGDLRVARPGDPGRRRHLRRILRDPRRRARAGRGAAHATPAPGADGAARARLRAQRRAILEHVRRLERAGERARARDARGGARRTRGRGRAHGHASGERVARAPRSVE